MRFLAKLIYYFPYLFLGHLIGDYVLQNSYIAARKGKDIRVLGLHVLLVYLSQLLVIVGINFDSYEFIVVSLMGVTHFGIDYLKLSCKNRFCRTWYYYILDQLMHATTLLIASFFMDVQPFFNRTLTVMFSISIFNGYFISILVYFILSNGNYKRDYIGYLLRMLAPFFYFLNIYYFIIYALICLVFISLHFSKANLLNYLLTFISTIILMEVML